MTWLQIAVLAAAGFVAGAMNAVAGGGTFVTFAALVVSGLPTLDANATSRRGADAVHLASVAAYRKEVRAHFGEMIPFAIIGLIGGGVGAPVADLAWRWRFPSAGAVAALSSPR